MPLLLPPDGPEAAAPALSPASTLQEVEVCWVGYAGRTMLPAFSLAGLATAIVLLLAELASRYESVPTVVVSHLAMYVIVAVWAGVLGRWAYLTATVAYRLTTRQLFLEHGFAHPARPPIALCEVRAVRVEQRRWERWVGVGRVIVEAANRPHKVLRGVLAPERLAAEIRIQSAALQRRA
jgi:hypothetical protein